MVLTKHNIYPPFIVIQNGEFIINLTLLTDSSDTVTLYPAWGRLTHAWGHNSRAAIIHLLWE